MDHETLLNWAEWKMELIACIRWIFEYKSRTNCFNIWQTAYDVPRLWATLDKNIYYMNKSMCRKSNSCFLFQITIRVPVQMINMVLLMFENCRCIEMFELPSRGLFLSFVFFSESLSIRSLSFFHRTTWSHGLRSGRPAETALISMKSSSGPKLSPDQPSLFLLILILSDAFQANDQQTCSLQQPPFRQIGQDERSQLITKPSQRRTSFTKLPATIQHSMSKQIGLIGVHRPFSSFSTFQFHICRHFLILKTRLLIH